MRRALLAALLAALCLPAGAAAKLPRDFFGVMANGPLDAPTFDLDAQSAAMRSAGVQPSAWRSPGTWSSPRGPVRLRAHRPQGARRGPRAHRRPGLIVRSPAWAARRPGQPFSSPRDPADYAAFATRARRPLRPQRARCGPRIPRSPRAPRPRRGRSGTSPTSRSTGRAAVHARPTRGCSMRPTRRSRAPTPARPSSWPGWPTSPGATSRGSPQGRRAAALRRRRGAPVQRPALQRGQDRPPQPRGARPQRRPAQAALAHRAHVVLGQGPQEDLTKDWETTEAGQAQRLRQVYRLSSARAAPCACSASTGTRGSRLDRDSPNSFDYSGLRTSGPTGPCRQAGRAPRSAPSSGATAPLNRRRPPGFPRPALGRLPSVVVGRHPQRLHRALLGLPRHAPVGGDEGHPPEAPPRPWSRRGRALGVPGRSSFIAATRR